MKRADKGRMEELREEVGEESVNVGWTCGKNGKGMVDEERVVALRVEGRRRRGRLRWKDCVKRDLTRV